MIGALSTPIRSANEREVHPENIRIRFEWKNKNNFWLMTVGFLFMYLLADTKVISAHSVASVEFID